MALSLTGGKSKSKEKSSFENQGTSSFSLSPYARGLLGQQFGALQNNQYEGLDTARIAELQNPNTAAVADAAMASFDANAERTRAQQQSDFAASKAFGDDRRGIYEAELDANLARDRAGMVAGLNADAYAQAQAAALAEMQGRNDFNLGNAGLLTQLLDIIGREGTTTSRQSGTGTGTKSGYNLGFGFTPFGK